MSDDLKQYYGVHFSAGKSPLFGSELSTFQL